MLRVRAQSAPLRAAAARAAGAARAGGAAQKPQRRAACGARMPLAFPRLTRPPPVVRCRLGPFVVARVFGGRLLVRLRPRAQSYNEAHARARCQNRPKTRLGQKALPLSCSAFFNACRCWDEPSCTERYQTLKFDMSSSNWGKLFAQVKRFLGCCVCLRAPCAASALTHTLPRTAGGHFRHRCVHQPVRRRQHGVRQVLLQRLLVW
jgi:hypothetical protein